MQPFLMTSHLQSIYRDPRIRPVKLANLTPMDMHADDRWKTRDLPSIQANGLWYPIIIFRVIPTWWVKSYMRWRPKSNKYIDPIINEDGMIWAVKMGSNRYQCAIHLGYEIIDAIIFDDQKDCLRLGAWFRDCDPLNNKNASPYTGAFGYKNV